MDSVRMKGLVQGFVSLLFIVALPGSGFSSIVSGDCDACHGFFPGMMEGAGAGTLACVNCHSNAQRDTVKTVAGVRVPVVFNTAKPYKPLAGGNFHSLSGDFGDRKGHNVEGVAGADRKYGTTPPGYSRETDPSVVGFNSDNRLSCSGSNGCHGDRNIEDPFKAVSGAHHGSDTPVDGSTIAKSFRYLRNTARVQGVTGYEDPGWGQSSTSSVHNEYTLGIDLICSSCHGDFHDLDRIGGSSPWFRHPTDVVLPKKGEYLNYVQYSLDAPLAREKAPQSPTDQVNPGSDLVICLSCHYAHGGPYESSLRWDYDSIVSGGEAKGGCFICHTSKAAK